MKGANVWSAFGYIVLDRTNFDFSDKTKRALHRHAGISELADTAMELATVATVFFSGVYPEESPHFWWGDGINLPWAANYFSLMPDGKSFHCKSIQTEVKPIAEKIFALAGKKIDPSELGWLTYQSNMLCLSPKSMIQGLSVDSNAIGR